MPGIVPFAPASGRLGSPDRVCPVAANGTCDRDGLPRTEQGAVRRDGGEAAKRLWQGDQYGASTVRYRLPC